MTKQEISDRQRRLLAECTTIKNRYGTEALYQCNDSESCIEIIPTGIRPVDKATGIGGIPRKQITEIFGPPSSAKTTIALHVIAEVQKRGGVAAFIAMEHAFNPLYAVKLGVVIDELLLAQPDSGEDAFGITEILIRSHAVDVIVIDSIAALATLSEINSLYGDFSMNRQAALMSNALKRLVRFMRQSRSALICINQTRSMIGKKYGNSETTTAGSALKFYASLRIRMRTVRVLQTKHTAYAQEVAVKIVKNKTGEPCDDTKGVCIFFYDPSCNRDANGIDYICKNNR